MEIASKKDIEQFTNDIKEMIISIKEVPLTLDDKPVVVDIKRASQMFNICRSDLIKLKNEGKLHAWKKDEGSTTGKLRFYVKELEQVLIPDYLREKYG